MTQQKLLIFSICLLTAFFLMAVPEKTDPVSTGSNPVTIGQAAPAIAGDAWVNSKPLTLDRLKGKVVIVDFWATWCGPCRRVMPYLADLYKQYQDKGLVVIGFTRHYPNYADEIQNKGSVTWEEELPLVKQFIERNKIPYPVGISKEDKEFRAYSIKAIPTMVFIDKKGNIAHIKVGAGNEVEISEKVKTLLSE